MLGLKRKAKKRRKSKKYSLKSQIHQPDWWLVVGVLGLTLFGLVMVANVSAPEALRDFSDRFYYLRFQAQWVFFGLLIFLAASLFSYQKWQKATPLFLFLIFSSLLLVILPKFGFRVFGARRWLDLGIIKFQPGELVKLLFITYLSAYLVKRKEILPLLLVTLFIVTLMMLQPDLGTTMIILTSGLVVYFVSGTPWWHLLLLGLAAVLGGSGLIFFSFYRRERFLSFLDPFRDPLGASYHIRQVLIAFGSGGFFGVGLGQSRQKYEYLPAVTTDSIFAVIAEELGFLGGLFLIFFYIFLIWRGFKIAQRAPDRFGQLLATGLTVWLGTQALINLGAMVVLVPLTGVPLPFISYGGSSMLLGLTAAGILVNISRQTI